MKQQIFKTKQAIYHAFKIISICMGGFLMLLNEQSAFAQISLPRIIRDSMILQREIPLTIWGWSSAKENISVAFQNKRYKTRANDKGEWKVTLPAMQAGGPFTMEIRGRNTIRLNEILIGDVWFCSGQSNMEHQMRLHATRYHSDIAESANPFIRQFLVPRKTNLNQPETNVASGSWVAADPETTGDFSAVAYFFAKTIYEKYRIPVGIINASVGGSPIEAWMSEAALEPFPEIMKIVSQNKDSGYVNQINREAAIANALPQGEDKGLTEKWYEDSYTPEYGWRNINIPGYWEDQGIRNLDGIVWYRKTIDIPAEMAGKEATVFLGRIVDADELYINGQKAGSTSYMYPQRIYPVPVGILKPGANVFAVRITNYSGKGGFVPDKPYYIAGYSDTVDLKGYWQYKVGRVFEPQTKTIQPVNLLYQPTALFHAMTAPFVKYKVRGFAWYQGESNTNDPILYEKLQKALIDSRRTEWQQPDALFLYVQLPGFMEMNYLPEESKWAEFREAQRRCLSVPHTGMAVTIDLGEWNDIHPDRKQEVGERLALQAQKVAYGEQGVFSGPMYQSQKISANKIEISFTSTGNGLITNDGGQLYGFEIAGRDRKYHNAQARIDGDKVIVWSDAVASPAYVRYAWADNPVNPNLYNKEGLPASPFTTDSAVE